MESGLQQKMKNRLLKKIFTVLLIVLCLFFAGLLLKAYKDGKFDSVRSLQDYIASFKLLGPIVLTVIQAFQVVIPILPGFLGCAVGAILFGSLGGFLCNYIGISAGSIAAFFLARKYGIKLVKLLFSEKKYEKWSGWIEKKKSSYDVILFIAILLPLFPDDFFCYFSGLTKMSAKRFIIIILIAKPWCILLYSLIFGINLW